MYIYLISCSTNGSYAFVSSGLPSIAAFSTFFTRLFCLSMSILCILSLKSSLAQFLSTIICSLVLVKSLILNVSFKIFRTPDEPFLPLHCESIRFQYFIVLLILSNGKFHDVLNLTVPAQFSSAVRKIFVACSSSLSYLFLHLFCPCSSAMCLLRQFSHCFK